MPLAHNWTVLRETEQDVVFSCANCQKEIGFNKEGVGEPCARMVDGQWVPSENPETWVGPCID